MSYFENAKEDEKVICKIYGEGKIIFVCKDMKYALMVSFNSGEEIPYTIDGIPAIATEEEQTLFYPDDI